MSIESTIGNLRQILNIRALAKEAPLAARFIVNSLDALSYPQTVKPYNKLLEKIDFNDPHHDANQNPVMLVPGFMESPKIYFPYLDELRRLNIRHAYWVPLYPFMSVEENAFTLSIIIRDVLKRTGRYKINLIGHSMGGLVVFYAAKENPHYIDKCVALGTPFHGTKFAKKAHDFLSFLIRKKGISYAEKTGYSLKALSQMFPENDFAKNLALDNGVNYYSIFSENDEVVLPWGSAIIKGATNMNVNEDLGLKDVGHIRLVYESDITTTVAKILHNCKKSELLEL